MAPKYGKCDMCGKDRFLHWRCKNCGREICTNCRATEGSACSKCKKATSGYVKVG